MGPAVATLNGCLAFGPLQAMRCAIPEPRIGPPESFDRDRGFIFPVAPSAVIRPDCFRTTVAPTASAFHGGKGNNLAEDYFTLV